MIQSECDALKVISYFVTQRSNKQIKIVYLSENGMIEWANWDTSI